MRPSRLFLIAVSLCCQLRTQVIDDAVGNSITENLVFAICAIHSLMGRTEHSDSQKFWSSLDQHEQAQFHKAFQLLESKKGRGVCVLVDGDQSENFRYFLVAILLKEVGEIALQMEDIQVGPLKGVTFELLIANRD